MSKQSNDQIPFIAILNRVPAAKPGDEERVTPTSALVAGVVRQIEQRDRDREVGSFSATWRPK